MIQKIKNNKLIFIIIILLLIVISIITKKIIFKEELLMDKLAYDILVTKLRNPTITKFMKLVTKLSNTKFIIAASLILILMFYIRKKKKISILIVINLLFIVLLNQTIKMIIKRERPTGFRLIEMTGYSFPSGHAMVSMAFYGLLIYLCKHLITNKVIRRLLITLNKIIILLIGISRVYLGVHYLSDVITGYSISIIYLLILAKLLKKYKVIIP